VLKSSSFFSLLSFLQELKASRATEAKNKTFFIIGFKWLVWFCLVDRTKLGYSTAQEKRICCEMFVMVHEMVLTCDKFTRDKIINQIAWQ
jgi:hypothetical protein